MSDQLNWVPIPSVSGWWWMKSGDYPAIPVRVEVHSGAARHMDPFLNMATADISEYRIVKYHGPIQPPDRAAL